MELTKLQNRIIENCKTVNIEDAYNDMLDECYSFDSVGGIFASMSPSRVLRECDPVAYRCGMNDYQDSLGLIEIKSDYYQSDDCEQQREELVAELEAEVSKLESDGDGEHQKEIDALLAEILLAEIKAVEREAL